MITCDHALHYRSNLDLVAALLPAELERLRLGLAGKLHDSLGAADENLGHLEEQLLRGGHELFRQMLEQAAQQKAGVAPPLCPQCQHQLSGVSEGHGTTIPTRFGPIRVQRARFACQPCRQWRFQADTLLGAARRRHTIARRAGNGRAGGQPTARRPSRTPGRAAGRN